MNEFKTDHLIIGNSAAGLSAAGSIRMVDKKASITILERDGHFNYSKPLIAYYLANKIGLEDTYFKDKKFYYSNSIDLKLNREVVSIDIDKKYVEDLNGEKHYYQKLLIATGGRPMIPKITVIDEDNNKNNTLINKISTTSNAFTLTRLDDAIALKKYIENNNIKKATILGGGLIGLKAAEAFLEIGIKIDIIELAGRVLSASFDQFASDMLAKKITSSGGNIFNTTTIDKIYIKDNKIYSLKLDSKKDIDCRLLVVAIGVLPDTAIFKDIKISATKGIIVDRYMCTSADNIYAAGDVAVTDDILSGKQKNMAIWPLAVRQGGIAGMNMAGRKAVYDGGFLMNSFEILGMPVISIGLSSIDNEQDDNIKIYRYYNSVKQFYKKIITRDNYIIGALFIGSIDRAGIYTGLIRNSVDISQVRENIGREDFGIIQLPADYKKHLVTGDGIEV